MQKLLTDCKSSLDLKGLSNSKIFFSVLRAFKLKYFFPKAEPLGPCQSCPSFWSYQGSARELSLSSSFTWTPRPLLPPESCSRRPFSGTQEETLHSTWRDSDLLQAGAMPSRAQRAVNTMAFTDWKCLGGQTGPGILWKVTGCWQCGSKQLQKPRWAKAAL